MFYLKNRGDFNFYVFSSLGNNQYSYRPGIATFYFGPSIKTKFVVNSNGTEVLFLIVEDCHKQRNLFSPFYLTRNLQSNKVEALSNNLERCGYFLLEK